MKQNEKHGIYCHQFFKNIENDSTEKGKKNMSNLFHVKIDPKSIANRVVSLHTDYNAKRTTSRGKQEA